MEVIDIKKHWNRLKESSVTYRFSPLSKSIIEKEGKNGRYTPIFGLRKDNVIVINKRVWNAYDNMKYEDFTFDIMEESDDCIVRGFFVDYDPYKKIPLNECKFPVKNDSLARKLNIF